MHILYDSCFYHAVLGKIEWVYICHGVTLVSVNQCCSALTGIRRKPNMLQDGSCRYVAQDPSYGWQTYKPNDWVYYPQQSLNLSITDLYVSVATVGGCCGPSRLDPSGFIFQDNGSTFEDTSNKITAISNAPMMQTVSVVGSYLKYFIDDHAMNFTLLLSGTMADKQAVLYGLAVDRAMLVTYQYLDHNRVLIGNYSSGVLRNSIYVPDVTLPRRTRFIEIAIYSSRVNPICLSYIYAGIYVDRPKATITKICSTYVSMLFSVDHIAVSGARQFHPGPYMSRSHDFHHAFFPVSTVSKIIQMEENMKRLTHTYRNSPFAHKYLLLYRRLTIVTGSFIFSQAWNLINSQSSIFDEWLPRAAKIIGFYSTLVLFGLRVVIDLPSFVITYAREVFFLSLMIVASVPAIIANCNVLLYFFVRIFAYSSCDQCRLEFLQVEDIEEQYVRNLFKKRGFSTIRTVRKSPLARLWAFVSTDIWHFSLWTFINRLRRHPLRLMTRWLHSVFGMNEAVRIPFPVKASLSLLLYCFTQLLIGVGGVIPTKICEWSPFLAQLQSKPDPMGFAQKSFIAMQVVVYIATVGAGGRNIYALGILRRVTKDILRIRRGDYGLFKGKKDNEQLGSIGFTGSLYFMFELTVIGTFITLLVVLDRLRYVIFHRVGYGIFFASFFVALIVQIIQKRITRMVFIKGRTRFIIQNRAPLLHYWYFMVFPSMTRALTSYIIRTLKLVLRYPFFSLRVDRNAETWSVRRGDGGFSAYCGMATEHEYNNPGVLIFIECLLHCISTKQQQQQQSVVRAFKDYCNKHKHRMQRQHQPEFESPDISDEAVETLKFETYYRISQRARTRWFLAYTLIRNPMKEKNNDILHYDDH
ncbi:hypothetical protein VTP01DRAFT_4764 [Rhizomucor pusillus]|uniref:uncharacterized protein n=1 Tax=Rhizomucor pusillus TaxID=4840 RepID=UPI003743D524